MSVCGGGVQSSTLDYRKLEVYAEGKKLKEKQIALRPSVSAEFECVDKIYETNILEGVIHDAEGNLENFLRLLKKRHVGILVTRMVAALNAYDLLLKYGIDICCFVSGTIDCEDRKLLGKPITGRMQAEVKWDNLILIDPDAKNSAWGFGQTDICSYLGFKRNQHFFALQDYIEVPNHGFQHILKYGIEHLFGRIVLAGDLWLCLKLKHILNEKAEFYGKIMYCDVLGKYKDEQMINDLYFNELQANDICLLLIPGYYGCGSSDDKYSFYSQIVINEYKEKLKCKTENIIEYPYEDIKFFKTSSGKKVLENEKTGCVPSLIPAKVILGAINGYSGNMFFRQILEGHPDIIMIPYSYLSLNLYSICERLSMERGSNILSLFWKIYLEESLLLNKVYENDIFLQKQIFNESMLGFLKKKESFASWELFVIIHISFARMQGKKIEDISRITIYWEPHFMGVNKKEAYIEWLDKIGSIGYLINVVRDAYVRAGSFLSKWKGRRDLATAIVFTFPNEEKIKNLGWKRIVLKFENLKKNAKEELQLFCKETGINWSDQLIENNKPMQRGVSIFNPAPVYRTWEKYFSSFDRFRICLIMGPWQKEYGYSCINSLDFSRAEIQEMFLKKFRYEEDLKFANDETEWMYFQQRQKRISENLWKVRKKEIMKESWDGVEQDEIQDCSKNKAEI